MLEKNTSPLRSKPFHSSDPSDSIVLIINDDSNPDDQPAIATPIPSQVRGTLTPLVAKIGLDLLSDSAEQQRRRNSSIAKLLVGCPSNNQQYEEINRQIIDIQSAQHLSHVGGGGTESVLQRSRSSITRTLLTETRPVKRLERTDEPTSAQLSSSSFAKNFEYLIRRELDTEHEPSTLQRNRSMPSVFRNVNSTVQSKATSMFPSKLKRKRVPSPTSESEPSIAVPPFALDHSRHVTIDSASPWNFSQHSSSMMVKSHNHLSSTLTLARQAQSLLIKTDDLESRRQRSYSNMSISSSRFSTASTEANVPLKKRLLHAYINEQRPNSPF